MTLSDEFPVEGDLVTVSGTIGNAGNLPGLVIGYRVTMDDEVLKEELIPSLGIGETVQVSGDWIAVRGSHVAKVEVDHAEAFMEINENNNTEFIGLSVNFYEMECRVNPELKEVQPGTKTLFKIEIENNGTLDDVYDVVVTDPPEGFVLEMEDDEAAVEVGKKAVIDMSVQTPDMVAAGTTASVDITITSRGNTTRTATLKAVTKIKKLTGFEMIALGDTDVFIDPRLPAEFEINVTNTGNDFDSVFISTEITNPGWMVMTNATNMKLDPYDTQVLKLTATPPFNPQGGDYIMITLKGETTSDLEASLTFTVTVMDIHNLSIITILEDNEVDPGGDLAFQIMMSNLGNNDESVEMWADVPEDWDAVFDEDIPYILAYGNLEGFMTLSVPDDALAGEYNITVGATGAYIEYEVPFQIIVTQYYGVDLEISPARNQVKQKEKTSFTLKVTNNGNGEDDFLMIIIGAPSTLRGSFDNEVITIAPGASEVVRMTIEAMTTNPGSYTPTVEAVSQGNKAKSASVVFQVQVLELKKDDNKKNKTNGNNTHIIDDPDPVDSSLFADYGLYLLVALIALIVIMLLAGLAIRKRNKDKEIDDMMASPPDGTGPPTTEMTSYDQLDRPPEEGPPPMAPPGPEGPPPEQPPGGPLDGPPSEGDQGPPLEEPPVGTMEAPPPEGTVQGPPPEASPPSDPAPPEAPPMVAQEAAPPTTEPVPEAPPQETGPPPMEPSSPPPGPQTPAKPAKKGDDIDSMITDLMGKLD